jgi:hypothetical protein
MVLMFLIIGVLSGVKLTASTLALAANATLAVMLLSDGTSCRQLAIGTGQVVLRAVAAASFVAEIVFTIHTEHCGET